ncbi:hypothetical protein B0H34DRAFT_793649 [Crassisporium funariophilum]|nr:hypothetical protein B0H34DRAFT_793649 [Crassisporium funariophilum]
MSYSAASYTLFPTTYSASQSFNLFIPSNSSSSRDTHEMYEELGFILRPSNSQASSRNSQKSSKTSSTKSRSSLRKWLGDKRHARDRSGDENFGSMSIRQLIATIPPLAKAQMLSAMRIHSAWSHLITIGMKQLVTFLPSRAQRPLACGLQSAHPCPSPPP